MKTLAVMAIGVALAVGGPAATATAGSVSTSPATELAMLDGSHWTIGGLALGTFQRSGGLSEQTETVRLGQGMAFTRSGEGAVLIPWSARYAIPTGGRQSASGLLLDIPYGSFTFTPSIGAGIADRTQPGGQTAFNLRSQFEVGYHFENASRLSLGYSRVTGVSGNAQHDESDMVSLTYRMPFTSLWPW